MAAMTPRSRAVRRGSGLRRRNVGRPFHFTRIRHRRGVSRSSDTRIFRPRLHQILHDHGNPPVRWIQRRSLLVQSLVGESAHLRHLRLCHAVHLHQGRQLSVPPVRIECPRIRIRGFGGSDHAACLVRSRHRSHAHSHLMLGFVPQRHFRNRRPPIPQHTRQRAAQLAHPAFLPPSFCGGKKPWQEYPTTSCRRWPVMISAASFQN